MIGKEYITDKYRIGAGSELVLKLGYIVSSDFEYVSDFNRRLAENTYAFFKRSEAGKYTGGTNAVLLLSPTLTYNKDDILSIRYDLTLSSGGAVLYHKRFGVNMHTSLNILISRAFLRGAGRGRDSSSFYLAGDGDGIVCVDIERALERSMRVRRQSDIDAYCDGKRRRVKLRLPDCVSAEALLAKRKKGRNCLRPAH